MIYLGIIAFFRGGVLLDFLKRPLFGRPKSDEALQIINFTAGLLGLSGR